MITRVFVVVLWFPLPRIFSCQRRLLKRSSNSSPPLFFFFLTFDLSFGTEFVSSAPVLAVSRSLSPACSESSCKDGRDFVCSVGRPRSPSFSNSSREIATPRSWSLVFETREGATLGRATSDVVTTSTSSWTKGAIAASTCAKTPIRTRPSCANCLSAVSCVNALCISRSATGLFSRVQKQIFYNRNLLVCFGHGYIVNPLRSLCKLVQLGLPCASVNFPALGRG